ncbi:MAG TPA: 2-dehydropantoate 2-reductase N-terminal domain-containing protein [Streptosporangiaceae bacterium]|nr:2-dehydropantoate 2-reductase N-terminal domain-containing protein [Streptosporangiaceae bacterium]
MRYIVIGAGGVGGTIGGRLAQAGHDVVLVARGPHLDALRAQGGLRLATPEGTSVIGVPAVSGPDEVELTSDDVLVLATKTQDAEAAMAGWAWPSVKGGTVAAEDLPVLCAQNGVASERLALRRFRHVYGVCVWLPATHLEPGLVEAQGAPRSGLLHLGRYPSGTDETIERIGADLVASRFLAPVVADIMRWKHGKLLANLANAIEAVCGLARSEDTRELRRRVRAEGRAALDAAGIPYAGDDENARFRADQVQIVKINGNERGGGSSWQSLTRGTGSIEADYLNGEIVLLGRELGVPTPVNDALQRLANQAARERRVPGSLNAEEVLALL